MKRAKYIATVIGTGMMLMPCLGFAQATADQPAVAPTTAMATPAAIPSDQQASKEQVAKLIEVMHIREQYKDLYAQLNSMTQQQAQATHDQYLKEYCGQCSLTPAQHTALDRIVSKYAAKLSNINSSDQRVDDLEEIFQLHFTQADIATTIAFYSSPSGQHIIEVRPIMMQEYVSRIMKRIQGQSKAIVNEMALEMKDVIQPQSKSATKPTAQ